MKAWILNIGDEVLRGRIENKNAAFLGRELTKLGILPVKCAVVGDDPEMIGKILEAFRKDDSEILITTGGLGPTHDDITKEAVFGFLGLETELRKEHMGSWKPISGSFRTRTCASSISRRKPCFWKTNWERHRGRL